jgi:UDP-GlcNAc:undecaprenyl-phosphate GlcNAc-1-phosphate transferase
MIYNFLFGFAVPIVISLLITPGVIWLAKRIGAVDLPNERKVHKVPTPRLGGVAIYASFFISVGLLGLIDSDFRTLISMGPNRGLMLTIALVMVLTLGIFDDLRPRTPSQKFLVQLLASTLVYLAGFRISNVTHPLGGGLLNLGILEYPATVLWIVGITNAFNLIDGLDGLAAGVGAIACFTICGVSLMTGELSTAMLVLILAGAVIGFLRYNFSPAKVFLGDSGSLFLGFALSVFSMQSSTKGTTALAILVPILALGLPIMDTLLSMIRRLLGSLLPQQVMATSLLRKLDNVFRPDNAHIHHRLVARGFSHRDAVLLLYLVSIAFGIGAFAVTTGNNFRAALILTAVAVATAIGVRQLRYKEIAVLRNGILLPMYNWPLVNRRFFQGFLDLAFINLAFVAAYAIGHQAKLSELFEKDLATNVSIACGIQLLVFYVSGLYKGTFRYTGLGDALKTLKAVILSVIVTGIALALLPFGPTPFELPTATLDFYFLLSLVLGSRLSFQILSYFFRKENGMGEKHVVIYGAGSAGLMVLHHLLNNEQLNLTPVGFLDDAPHLEGKRLNGYPIFGGHWKIPKILRQYKVEEIIVSSSVMKPQVLIRLRNAVREYGIKLRRLNVDVVEFPIDTEITPPVQPPARIKKEGQAQDKGQVETSVPRSPTG